MAQFDISFDDEQQQSQPESPGTDSPFDIDFTGEESREITARAEPVDQNIFEKISTWYQGGYQAAKRNIAQQKGLAFDETPEDVARTAARVKELGRLEERHGPDARYHAAAA